MSANTPTQAQNELSSFRAWEILDAVPDVRGTAYARSAACLLNVPAAFVVIPNGQQGMHVLGSIGLEARDINPATAFVSVALQNPGSPLLIEDASLDLRFASDPLVSGPAALRFCLALPLREPDGGCSAVLCLLDRKPRSASALELERVQDIATALADSLYMFRNVTALCEAALRDTVTGVGNRTAFECNLDRAIQEAGRTRHLAVLCVNTDRLQSVNTMFGHAGGDSLLRQLAGQINGALPHAAAVARTGADEFAILLFGVRDASEIAQAADALIEAAAAPVMISGQPVPTQANVGFAMYPDDGDSPALLLDRAKASLQEAKRDGKGSTRRFEAAMEATHAAKHELEQDLRRAIDENQFYLYWQPICDAATRQPVAYEALLRWDRPGHGPVPPGQFIGAAEACGLSGPLDAWVLRTACKEAAAWPDTSLRAAVNVSANRIRFGDLSDSVAAALASSGLAPARLEIEITESVLTEDEAAVRKALEALRALGVRIALDDFGTGVSSLSYLRSLPLDKLKLDRTFIRDLVTDPKSQEVARTVVRLGSVLGLIVIAEGVETEEQMSCLRVMGCDEVQGYLLGWPRPLTFAAESKSSIQRSALRAAVG